MGTGKNTLLQNRIQAHLEERKKEKDILIDSVSYSLPTSIKEKIFIKICLI